MKRDEGETSRITNPVIEEELGYEYGEYDFSTKTNKAQNQTAELENTPLQVENLSNFEAITPQLRELAAASQISETTPDSTFETLLGSTTSTGEVQEQTETVAKNELTSTTETEGTIKEEDQQGNLQAQREEKERRRKTHELEIINRKKGRKKKTKE